MDLILTERSVLALNRIMFTSKRYSSKLRAPSHKSHLMKEKQITLTLKELHSQNKHPYGNSIFPILSLKIFASAARTSLPENSIIDTKRG